MDNKQDCRILRLFHPKLKDRNLIPKGFMKCHITVLSVAVAYLLISVPYCHAATLKDSYTAGVQLTELRNSVYRRESGAPRNYRRLAERGRDAFDITLFPSNSVSGLSAIGPNEEIIPFDLGIYKVDQSSPAFMFTLRNGSASNGPPWIIGAFAIDGPDANQFQITQNGCTGAVLAPGASCTFFTKISPTRSGYKEAQVTIPSLTSDFPTVYGYVSGGGVTPWLQHDPFWGDDLYDHHPQQKKMKAKGCATTSLSMALDYANVPIDPGVSNEMMKEMGGYDSSANVIWATATKKVASELGVNADFVRVATRSTATISDLLTFTVPVIVGVNLNPSGVPGHYVLVIREEDSGRFQIIDPGYGKQFLDEYPTFVSRGVVAFGEYLSRPSMIRTAEPVGGELSLTDKSSIDVSADPNVRFYISDDLNRRAGLELSNASSLEEIPGSAVASERIDDDVSGEVGETSNSVYVKSSRRGKYRINVRGLGNGPFQVSIKTYNKNGVQNKSLTFSGTATVGSTQIFEFFFTPTNTISDFDGDGVMDLSVIRPSNNSWFFLRSSTGYTSDELGAPGDLPAPSDFDGDGAAEMAVFRPSTGTWYCLNLASRSYSVTQFGQNGDIPVPADYDGDGKSDLAVYRPSSGKWYIRASSSDGSYADTFTVFQFGETGDKPQIGDFDGDGKSDFSLFRPSNNVWYFYGSVRGFTKQTWGATGDIVVPGDFDGDGKMDVATFRPSVGRWYIVNSQNNSMRTQNWGASGDQPFAGDFDGDGKADLGVFRPTSANWYILSSTAAPSILAFGQSADLPTQTTYFH